MKTLFTVLLTVGLSQSAWALWTPVTAIGEGGSDPAKGLQGIIDNAGNTLVTIGSDADQLDDLQDSLWMGLGDEGVALIVEFAGYAPNNNLGIYSASDPTQKQLILEGSDSPVTSVPFSPSYGVFGFYLENTVNGSFTYFSDSTLNTDGQKDHMVAYQGKGETLTFGSYNIPWDANSYLLAWEDLSLGDADYNDLVVVVKNVRPVPDGGATLVLLGAGLMGLASLRRKLS